MIPTYFNRFIPGSQLYFGQPTLFDHLMSLKWLEVTEARKEYFMAHDKLSYIYGKGDNAREYWSEPYTKMVLEVLNRLNQRGNQYNVCFLNRYDTQKHQLGWHADDSPSMDKNHPIAVISLGAEREIWWKLQDFKGPIPDENKQLLKNGSLFEMPAGFQDKYFHRIPKCDRPCGIRISLTFRRYI